MHVTRCAQHQRPRPSEPATEWAAAAGTFSLGGGGAEHEPVTSWGGAGRGGGGKGQVRLNGGADYGAKVAAAGR